MPVLVQRIERRHDLRALAGLERSAAEQEHRHEQDGLIVIAGCEAAEVVEPLVHRISEILVGRRGQDGAVEVNPSANAVEQAGGVARRGVLVGADPVSELCVDGLGVEQGLEIDDGPEGLDAAGAHLVAQGGDLGDGEEEQVLDAEVGGGVGGGGRADLGGRGAAEDGAAVERGDGVDDVEVDDDLREEVLEVRVGGRLAGHQVAGRVKVHLVLAEVVAGHGGGEAQHDGLCDRGVICQVLLVAGVAPGHVLLPEQGDGLVEVIVAALYYLWAHIVGHVVLVDRCKVEAREAEDGMHQAAVPQGHGDYEIVERRP